MLRVHPAPWASYERSCSREGQMGRRSTRIVQRDLSAVAVTLPEAVTSMPIACDRVAQLTGRRTG